MILNNTGKINIMFIIDFFHGEGGTERHLHYLVKNIDKEKYNCFICSFNSIETTGLIKETREVIADFYHIPVGKFYTFNALKRAIRLSEIIRKNQIDIVQTYHFKSDTYGVLISKLSGVKHIISSRRDMGDIKKKRHIFLNKLMNRFVDSFIVVADAVGEKIAKEEKVLKEKIKTIYNGVDIERFCPPKKEDISRLREKLGISNNDFIIGTVSHFRPEKSYDVFFKAMKEVKEVINELKIIAVGSGPTLESSMQYCKDNDLSARVLFPGQIKKVWEYIAIMDIACLVPGSNEGFSNAILEKMAMGKPLIVTSVGGNAEAVVNGENGIVIPPFDHKRLAEAIIYLYRNPAIREKMGKKSRERVEKLFTIENMIKKHESLYEEVISSAK